MILAKDTYSARYRSIEQEAALTPLIFRQHAREAMKHYSDELRHEDIILDAQDSFALKFYTYWQETLVPNIETIKTARANKKLLKEIMGSYLLSEEKARKLIQKLIRDQISEQENNALSEFYLPYERKARKIATKFLRRSEKENSERIEKYISYELYSTVAKENGFSIYDAHALLVARVFQGLSEQSQIKTHIRQTKKRMKAIDTLTAELETQNDGLIASIFALRIDLVTIRANYQKYEKALQKLSETARKSPAKQLSLYEKETSAIRSAHLDAVSGMQSLQDIQHVAKEIDTVLMRVFDLTTRQYNELMLQMKEYRELTRERSELDKSLKTV